MLSHLIETLNRSALSGWQVREMSKTSHQSFLALRSRECARTTDTTVYEVTVYQKRPEPDGQETLGMSRFRLGAAEMGRLPAALEEALFAAGLVSNQPFELPEAPSALPQVRLADDAVAASALPGLEERLTAAIAREKGVRLSGAEFFIDRVRTRLLNHKGLDLPQEETFLHTEFILLARAGERENEYIDRYTRRLLSDFNLEAEVEESARFAREATQARLPKTGRFPVLLSGEPLDHLFNPLVAKASARFKYNRMVASTLGQSVAAEGERRGDAITLWSNSLIDGAVGSSRFDGFGTPGKRVCLIQENRFAAYVADKRYADYLGVPATGELGNIEVEAGKTPFSRLSAATGGTTVYHLQAFSAFEPNPITGAFSAEIRAGYEITASGTRPIKGGSVSGVLQEAMLQCTLSSERVQRERSLVPQGIFFADLAIAGE